MPPLEMRFEKLAITPALAEQFLKRNVVNRKRISKLWVDALAREMKQGSFLTTDQGLAFNTKGDLINGQHRLNAIVQSGCTVVMWVCWDCPAETAMKWPVDRGLARSAGDMLGLSKIDAAMTDLILRLHTGRPGRFTIGERETTYDMFRIHLATLTSHCNTGARTRSKTVCRLAALLRMLQHGEEPVLQYRAFLLLDYGAMWPSVQALTRKVTLTDHDKHESDYILMSRVWIALDPAKKNITKIQINDHAVQISEMRDTLVSLGLQSRLEAAGCVDDPLNTDQ